MAFSIILTILIFLGIVIAAIVHRDISDLIFLIPVPLILIISILISFLVGMTCTADETYKTETRSMVALKDNVGEHGSFFLGSGHSDSDLYYFYYTKGENNELEFNKIKAESAHLFEGEPKIEVLHKTSSNPIVNFFFIVDQVEYNIYVPKENIDYSFEVDLE